jgi:dTDP-4-amino-4,6-dideoxy-D-galactose acyltransferase
MSEPAEPAQPAEYLAWDSTFFGRRIARVCGHRASPARADEVLAWCEAQRIECVYFLVDADDRETVVAVERRGFGLVDIRMTLTRTANAAARMSVERAPGIPVLVRPARQSDVPALKAMARSNHGDSRFYFDGNFARERCDALYETWIERSVDGYAAAVLVAELDGQPAGYVSCHVEQRGPDAADAGSIGLLGVRNDAQGHGLGGVLIDAALAWFTGRGITSVDVVTQGRNVRAQRAYQRRGFVSKTVQLWFHRWFEATSDGGAPVMTEARSRTA